MKEMLCSTSLPEGKVPVAADPMLYLVASLWLTIRTYKVIYSFSE